MATEITVDHDEIKDPQKVTQVNIREFKKKGLDIHLNEVESLEDDFKKKKRILRVKGSTKYFFMGK